MAEVQPQLVHKQFNSPIGLYSEQNIKDTINREIKAIGGTGIDLDDQISSKPSHLANSHVLKMLQEEESERYLGYKRVAWPPTPDHKVIREFTPQPQSQGETNQGPYYNNTAQTNHSPQQQQQQLPQNRYLSPQPPSQQHHPNQSQSQPNPQSYPGQQYFPKQQPSAPYQPQPQHQPQYQPQHQPQSQPKFQPQSQPETQPQHLTAPQNSYPSHNQHNQPRQPSPMSQSLPAVAFAGGIPVKSIPGLSPIEPPQSQQQYHPNDEPQSNCQQQGQPIYQAQHQSRYQPQEQSSAAPYYQQPQHQSQPQSQYQSQPQPYNPQQNPSNIYGGWSHVSAPKYQDQQRPMIAPQSHQQHHQQQQQPSYSSAPVSHYGQSQGQQYQPPHNPNQNQNPYHAEENVHPQYQQQHQQPEYNSQSYPQQQYRSQGGQPQQQHPQQYGQQQQQPQQYGQQQQQPQQYGQQQQQPQQYGQQQPPHSGIVTLRKDPPYTQQLAPTVVSQPAARSLRGGSVMRGDLKWPPQDCRERMAAEAELQRQLALGPALRPSRMHKDYSGFFAKHALSHYYPGYKIPPGTQHILAEF